MARPLHSLILLFISVSSSLFAADITWLGSTSRDWATGSNWVGGSVPSSSDVAVFTGLNDSVFFSANASVGGVKVLSNANIIFKGLGNYTLTATTTTGNSAVFVESGSQLSITSDAASNYLTLAAGTSGGGTSGEISGTLTIFGYERTLRTDGGGKLTVASGTFNVNNLLNYFGGDNPSVSGTLTVNAAATLNLGRDNYNLPTVNFNAASTCLISAKTMGTLANANFGNLTINSPNLTANQSVGLPSTQGTQILIFGNLRIEDVNGQDFKLGSPMWSLYVQGTTDIYDGTFAFSNHTTSTYATRYIYVTLSNHLTVHSGATLDLQISSGEISMILQQNLDIQSGATFKATNATNTYPASLDNSKVTFGGAASAPIWTINGSLGSEPFNFFIDKSSGKVVLGSNITLPNRFTFNGGNVEIGNYMLNAAEISSFFGTYDATKHFIIGTSGALTIRGVAATEVTFPLGTSESTYDELRISRPSPSPATLDFTVNLKTTFTNTVADAVKVVAKEWNITPAGSTSTTSLYFKPHTNLGSVPTPVVGHWTGSAWEELSATLNSGTYFVQTSAFSPFGVGTSGGFLAVLPVEFLSVNAVEKDASNSITWQTANELNVQNFVVERCDDLGNFTPLSILKPNGNKTYQFIDNQPLTIGFYRIKSVDFSGKETISKTLSVERGSKFSIQTLFPNPITEGVFVRLNGVQTGSLTVELVDIFGQIVVSKKMNLELGATDFKLDVSRLSSGTYFLKISQNGKTQMRRLVKN